MSRQAAVNLDFWRRVDMFGRDGFFRSTCLLCEAVFAGPHRLCPSCRADLPVLGSHCRACALPLAVDGLCGRCQQRPPVVGEVWAALLYQPPLDSLLRGLKFHRQLLVATCLSQLMAEQLRARDGVLPELIVPVPLHRQRLRQRGFNQALEIARPLAATLGVPVDHGCCQRSQATASQSGLSARQRESNVRHAFRLRRCPKVRHLALVDDVLTTGATTAALAKLFLRAGVGRVDIWVCARVLLRSR